MAKTLHRPVCDLQRVWCANSRQRPGRGLVIQGPLNSAETTTLATFGTLGDLLAGCVARVREDACATLFAA